MTHAQNILAQLRIIKMAKGKVGVEPGTKRGPYKTFRRAWGSTLMKHEPYFGGPPTRADVFHGVTITYWRNPELKWRSTFYDPYNEVWWESKWCDNKPHSRRIATSRIDWLDRKNK
jgi:hypothetical protein